MKLSGRSVLLHAVTMGRGYIVDDVVEKYLSQMCEPGAAPVTGLLIGQSSAQRDFVVMATRTPLREESHAGSSLAQLDMEWITEHARQVSRMLPGGLFVLGVFIITSTDAKDTLHTLRQLVFSVDSLISKDRLWSPADNDITERIALHINAQTRKTVCRTFDVRDAKSTAKPADWKSQSGVCVGWLMVSCSVGVDLLLALPEHKTNLEDTETCLKEGLKSWAHRIEGGVCLIDGKKLSDDTELSAGQKKNVKQTIQAQILIKPVECDERSTAVVQRCGGDVLVRGTVHARAYIHSNRPRGGLAEKMLKRDAVSTVAVRVQMLLEDLLTGETSQQDNNTERLSLPCRVFCPVVGAGPVCVCDYQFREEEPGEVLDRLREILDIQTSEDKLDTSQETAGQTHTSHTEAAAETPLEPRNNSYTGVAMAAAVALLATAASLLYLNDY